MKKVAIITARGGSKRIPRKNIKPFLGKPLIAYSIEAAINSGLFDEVMVSTEDEEIATISKEYGAKVPFVRSQENADDFASTLAVLLEVLEDYRKIGIDFDYGCCLYPTAPFITTDLLTEGYNKLVDHQFDTVFPVLPFSFPIQRALKINDEERAQMFQPQYYTSRSQDLERAYHDSGQFYWFSVPALKKNKKLLTNNTGVVELSEMDAHDIDNMEDFKIAEFKYRIRSGNLI